MNKGIIFGLGLAVGGIIGAGAGMILALKKMKKLIANGEIDIPVEADYEYTPKDQKEDSGDQIVMTEKEQLTYDEIRERYAPVMAMKPEIEVNADQAPVIGENGHHCERIDEADFRDWETYDASTLTLSSDGVLYNEDWEPLDPDEWVGGESLAEFAMEQDCDTMYIRNDRYMSYYEVNKDEEGFEEMLERVRGGGDYRFDE